MSLLHFTLIGNSKKFNSMWKKCFLYAAIGLFLLLLIAWRIHVTQWKESIVPGLGSLSVPVLWTIVIVCFLIYLVIGYRSVKKKLDAGHKKEAVSQILVLAFPVVVYMAAEIWLGGV